MERNVAKIQNKKEFEALANDLFEGMLYLSNDGIITAANPSACNLFGYDKNEIEGKPLLNLLWPYTQKQAKKGVINSYPTTGLDPFLGDSLQQGRSSEGDKIPLQLRLIQEISSSEMRYIACIRSLDNNRLQPNETKSSITLNTILNRISSALIIIDLNHDIIYCNQEFCTLLNIEASPNLVTDINLKDLLPKHAQIFVNSESFIAELTSKPKKNAKRANTIYSTKDGREIELDYLPLEVDHSVKGHIFILRDVSKLVRGTQKSKHQASLLAAVVAASNMLLTANPQNMDNAVYAALERVGVASKKDHICILEVVPTSIKSIHDLKIRHKWVRDALSTPQLKPNISTLQFPYLSSLKKGAVINEKVADLPHEIQSICLQFDVKTVAYLPIHVGGNLWGILSLSSAESDILLTEEEIAILSNFAQSLGGAIDHSEIAIALEAKAAKLLELNASLEEATKQAKKMSEEAALAAKAKTQFLATMSHEIRTPMNGVIGMTSLLQRTKLDEEQREYLATIRNSGDALLTIINDILDFSKIESGNMELELNPFDIRLCIEDVLDLFWLPASQKNIDISYWVSPEIRRKFTGDVSRIRQILVNLVGNAIKFTHKGSILIEVRMQQSGKTGTPSTLEVKIIDTGIGIPEDKRHKLFKPFNQVDSTITRRYGGTGLGLAISSRLVELMGGSISAESTVGEGSTFTFTLILEMTGVVDITAIGTKLSDISIFPHILNEHNRVVIRNFLEALNISSAARSYEKSLVITDDQNYHVEGVRAILLNSTHEKVEANRFVAQLYLPLKLSNFVNTLKKTLLANDIAGYEHEIIEDKSKLHERYPIQILVAEDNTINQKLMRKTLSYYGYTADIVANGLEVLEALERQTYDLIFMDIQMPEMDGLEATRRIVEKYRENRPRIIAMTASALGADRENCLKTGMDDYTSKPIKIEVVEKMIVKWNPKAKKFS